jgi:hypothetical protein
MCTAKRIDPQYLEAGREFLMPLCQLNLNVLHIHFTTPGRRKDWSWGSYEKILAFMKAMLLAMDVAPMVLNATTLNLTSGPFGVDGKPATLETAQHYCDRLAREKQMCAGHMDILASGRFDIIARHLYPDKISELTTVKWPIARILTNEKDSIAFTASSPTKWGLYLLVDGNGAGRVLKELLRVCGEHICSNDSTREMGVSEAEESVYRLNGV